VAGSGGAGAGRLWWLFSVTLIKRWVGAGEATTVGGLQREERQRGGVRTVLPLLLHVLRSGSGQRGLGSTAEDSSSMATGSRRTGIVRLTVKSIFWIFAHHVLDQMPARNQIRIFENFHCGLSSY
jgi:hypothetical protein